MRSRSFFYEDATGSGILVDGKPLIDGKTGELVRVPASLQERAAVFVAMQRPETLKDVTPTD